MITDRNTHAIATVAALLTLCAVNPSTLAQGAANSATPTAADIPLNQLKEAYFGEQHLHTTYSLGERKPDANGKLPPVGNTVELKTATFTNSIGAVELKGTWSDPDCDASQNALYYVRVIQIPTPRWSTFDAVRAGLPLQDGVASTVQERAWTSPIWYTPAAKSSL